MEHEAASPQQLIDVSKEGLALVKWNKLDLGMDNEALLESPSSMRENFRLASLCVEFKQIAAVRADLGDIVEPNGVDILDCHYLHEIGQVIEKCHELQVWS